jgi:O-antigen/teichoic acid export membrane protein
VVKITPAEAEVVRDRQLPKGALYVSLGQVVFLLSGYILTAVLARWLMPSLYGQFVVIMTVLVWVEVTVNNGVPLALQRFLPDRMLSQRSVRRAAARCQALIGVGVFLVMLLAAPLLAELLRDPSLTGYLRLALVDVLAMGAYAYYRGVLNGYRAFRQLSLTITAYALTKLSAICLLVYLGFGVRGALVGNIVASLGGLAAGFFWARHRWSLPLSDASHAEGVDNRAQVSERQVLAFVFPAALFTLASNVLLGLDLMGVKALVGNEMTVGYYSAAVNLANAPRLVLLAFSFTLLPSLSHSIAGQDWAQTRHYLQQTTRLLALVLLPILALVTGTAEALVTFVFSMAYQPAAPILTVLIFAYAAYTVYITLVSVLLAENRPGRALAIPLFLLPMAAAAIWLGIASFGALGAALAALSAVALAAAIVTGYVFHRYRPQVSAVSLGRIALAAGVVGVLAWLWSPSGLVLLLAYGLLVGLYLALLLLLREIKPTDLAMARSWLSVRSTPGSSRPQPDS